MAEIFGWYDTAYHALDAQKRLSLPKAVQPLLQGTFVVFAPKISVDPHEIPHLIVMPLDLFEGYRKRITAQYQGQQRNIRFTLLSRWSETMTLDSTGRISLKQELRDYAGLDGSVKVAIVGQGRRFELWREDKLEEQCALALEAIEGDEGVALDGEE
jgi:DNA-binding transcriptional regulator/RsmH inhibitor MraZ